MASHSAVPSTWQSSRPPSTDPCRLAGRPATGLEIDFALRGSGVGGRVGRVAGGSESGAGGEGDERVAGWGSAAVAAVVSRGSRPSRGAKVPRKIDSVPGSWGERRPVNGQTPWGGSGGLQNGDYGALVPGLCDKSRRALAIFPLSRARHASAGKSRRARPICHVLQVSTPAEPGR
jgi:hypothetical protein